MLKSGSCRPPSEGGYIEAPAPEAGGVSAGSASVRSKYSESL